MPYELVEAGAQDTDYRQVLEDFANARKNGVYPRTIFVGLGGTGSKSLLNLRRMILERFGKVYALPCIAYLSVDTDITSVAPSAEEQKKKDPFEELVRFKENERVDVKCNIASFTGRNLVRHPHIQDWWDPSNFVDSNFNLEKGAGQIRPLARLVFFANHAKLVQKLRDAYQEVTKAGEDSDRVDTDQPVRVVVIAGWAGGTGSGIFLDFGALIKQSLPGGVSLEGFFALPGVFEKVEKAYAKAAANGFAALREVNHYLRHPFTVQWEGHVAPKEVEGLYDRYVLISGTNLANQTMPGPSECYHSIAEALFMDFAAGPMSGWVQGVRINRAQYLAQYLTYTYMIQTPNDETLETHAERWNTAFSSFGVSKLVFPSWRLLNQAKYEIASRMVGLMDPSRDEGLKEMVTRHRDRFMYECGFFQGELLKEDDTRGTHWQIRDRLHRLIGAPGQPQSVREHIEQLVQQLIGLSESMFTEKTTEQDGQDKWRYVDRQLMGDPSSPDSKGDWTKAIEANQAEFVREVRRKLPQVVEEFRRKPAVGPSGVKHLLLEILETLRRPADQARYEDWFQRRVPEEENTVEAARSRWKGALRNTARTAKGFRPNMGNHQAALELAAEDFRQYFRSRANIVLCQQAVKALESIERIVQEQLSRLESICDTIFQLKSHYENCRTFYLEPRQSVMFQEIPVPASMGDLLEPYLGHTAEEQQQRLQLLLDRGLREMGLETLESINSRLQSDLHGFRDNLAAQVFDALHGRDGWTNAFGETPELGFVERNSILRVLQEHVDPESFQRYIGDLYKRGLPWISKASELGALGIPDAYSPKADAFIGFMATKIKEPGGQVISLETVRDEILEICREKRQGNFSVQHVGNNDPSEIIFYTELSAFAGYYIGEVHQQNGLKHHYDSLLENPTKPEPLHLHQDYHEFQDIVPLSPDEVDALKNAWRIFLKAVVFNLIQTVQLRAGDHRRAGYQYQESTGPFDTRWIELGPQAAVIRRLRRDRRFRDNIAKDLEEAQSRFFDKGGSWAQLITMADYYYYCIFPTRTEGQTAGTGISYNVGSMQNMVCTVLREEWRERASSLGNLARDAVDQEIMASVRLLEVWTKPICRNAGQVVPGVDSVPPNQRLDEWGLLDHVEKAIWKMVTSGVLRDDEGMRNDAGDLVIRFPYLAIDWDRITEEPESKPVPPRPRPRPRPAEPESVPPKDFFYKRDGERVGDTPADKIAEAVAANPGSRHRVYLKDDKRWEDASAVPAIQQYLPNEPPPDDDEIPPDDDEIPPDDDE